MYYLDFLRGLHEALDPATYMEIGIRHGDSLALARCPAVGIDPEFHLHAPVAAGTTLFRESSDEYFERKRPLEPLGDQPVDLAFIDGMHLAEFALRDFVNVERHARWTSVAVFDDILPRDPELAARDRRTVTWTGDVFKLLGILDRHRPDLICLRVGTEPTGLLLVAGLNPQSRTLIDRYDRILEETLVPDPQRLPADVVERSGVHEPEAVLAAGLWPQLRDARLGGVPRGSGLRQLRDAVRRDLGQVSAGRLRRLLASV